MPYESRKTKAQVAQCCDGIVTVLAPVSGQQLADYGYSLNSSALSKEPHITSFSMSKSINVVVTLLVLPSLVC